MAANTLFSRTGPHIGKYGYGLYIANSSSDGTVKTVIGHNGSISGFSCSLLHFVEDDVTVILVDNTRAEKRGNLENITAGITAILHRQPPKPPMPSAVVVLAEVAATGSGTRLVARYKEMQEKNGSYRMAGAAAFLEEASTYFLQHNRTAEGVLVAKFATEESPQSTSAWNAYGAALWQHGQTIRSGRGFSAVVALKTGGLRRPTVAETNSSSQCPFTSLKRSGAVAKFLSRCSPVVTSSVLRRGRSAPPPGGMPAGLSVSASAETGLRSVDGLPAR